MARVVGGRVDEEDLLCRSRLLVRALEQPQVQPDVQRGCRAGREGDYGAQCAATDKFRPDASSRSSFGGGRWHEHDDPAALLRVAQAVLHPGQF
ncbi:hypothetical protein Prum_039500 [Phytohabitans rumicis]|uniref:Uncharacterized protein n=1 Tax=Phytohabitans rumicis TaxID=1076125 RepID=A0A6V8L5M2_9ACTN|nr:hypothetical protein Prum_039500 [Phytohabitans rumicis]